MGTLQPTLMVSYRADVARVFDATDPAALAARGNSLADLGDPDWRWRMNRGRPVPTQALASALIEDGYDAMRVRSFAPGAAETDETLVLWQWHRGDGRDLVLQDEEGRLSSPGL